MVIPYIYLFLTTPEEDKKSAIYRIYKWIFVYILITTLCSLSSYAIAIYSVFYPNLWVFLVSMILLAPIFFPKPDFCCVPDVCPIYQLITNRTSSCDSTDYSYDTLLHFYILPEPFCLSIALLLFILTLLKIHQNRHILSETRKKAELSIIYQNLPFIFSFISKYSAALVIYLIRVENDGRDEVFKSFVCNDLTTINFIFPITYTVANFQRLRVLFAKCCCCFGRGNRISDHSLQYMSTTGEAPLHSPNN
ncbi:unnamed protein product [Caenorhabditis angaria]|uniref:Uncharacterized protein n=1 Tax=Caenorhabditis angaria TaxID=860376 RepID=A0A9P1MXW4_9PELO|nr:unnamed protein product [Caenorhabditis angaria]